MLLPCLWVAGEQGGPVFSSASYSMSQTSLLNPAPCRYASNGTQERSQLDPVHSDPPQHRMYFLQAAHNPVLLWMDLEVVELAFSFCQQHLDHCPTVQLSTHNNTHADNEDRHMQLQTIYPCILSLHRTLHNISKKELYKIKYGLHKSLTTFLLLNADYMNAKLKGLYL